jgi:hypothetical protein
VEVAAAEVHILIDVFGVFLSVDNVCEISSSFHIISVHVIGILVKLVLLLDDWLSEPELVLE